MRELFLIRELAKVVFFTSESNQTFTINVDSEWIKRGNDYVKAEVEFMLIKKEGTVNVSGDYATFMLWHTCQLIYNVDATTSRRTRWLDNP